MIRQRPQPPWMRVNEADLVKHVVQNRSGLIAYAWAILRDEHKAEDVLQTVCLSVLQKLDQIQDEDHLAGWLRTAIRFEALKTARSLRRDPSAVDPAVIEAIDRAWDEAGRLEQREVSAQLAHCLQRLTPRARRILHLRYVEGLTGAHLAARLGSKANAAYVGLSRAHRALSECMDWMRKREAMA